MKKNSQSKLIVISVTLALIAGLVGGALTNEYLIASLFNYFTDTQEGESIIVKKIIEEKVYVEESSTLNAIAGATSSLVLISDNAEPGYDFKSVNSDLFYLGFSPQKAEDQGKSLAASGVLLTTDGIIATCGSFVKDRNSWVVFLTEDKSYTAKVVYRDQNHDLAFLKINTDSSFEYFDTLSFNSKDIKPGQKVLALGAFDKVKSGIISALTNEQQKLLQIDFEIDSSLSCGPTINLGGELIGLTVDFDTIEQGTSYVIPSSDINNALEIFKQNLP